MFDLQRMEWTREPRVWSAEGGELSITTEPGTDLWQRTYYHFRNDNAPALQFETAEPYFSFSVCCDFSDAHHRFDQCGVVMYLDSENWLKGSVEYENEAFCHLGSVVTNHGWSDWATTEVPADVRRMWYRLSRRGSDYRIECSADGARWQQMRVCHLREGGGTVRVGVYACSPENSSFTARFSCFELGECAWLAHDGQPPEPEEKGTAIEHVALYVNDLEAAKRFFVTYLGGLPNNGYHNKETGFRSYFISFSDGARIEIMTRPDMVDVTKPLNRTGYAHVAFSVGSKARVDELTARLKADGFAVVSGPRTTGDGYYESCIVAIEDNRIEITV